MTLTWIVAVALLDCHGVPDPGVVRYAADYGLNPTALTAHVETPVLASEVVLAIPLDPWPGEVVYADYYALDEAGNRSECQ